MNCKVCFAPVRPRKLYQPRTCEACQKFFRRSCMQRKQLECVNKGKQTNCYSNPSKGRNCAKCRFDRCLKIGMQSKFLDGFPTSVTSPSSIVNNKDKALVTSSYENLIQTAVQAYTKLHGLEFQNFRRPQQSLLTADPSVFCSSLLEQVQTIGVVGFDYVKQFVEEGKLDESDIDYIMVSTFGNTAVAFYNLSGNQGASFFGLNDNLVTPRFLSFFPQFREANAACKQLASALDEWNPSFVESALLLSILLFQDDSKTHERVNLLEERLLLSFNLHVNATKPAQFQERLDHFKKCIQLAKCAAGLALRSVGSLADRGGAPLFKAAVGIIKNTEVFIKK